MTKTFAEKKFEESRKRLSDAIALLEKTVKQKIHETSTQAKLMKVARDGETEMRVKIVEQAAIIDNLNAELNSLQKELENAGMEVEFLNDKNKMLANKMHNLRDESLSLTKEIELDLIRIEELVKNEE